MSDHANQPNGHAIHATRGPQHATYLAECYWPGVTAARLAAAAARAAEDAEATCTELILIPGDEIVLALFRASSAAAVTQASRRAGLPAERIVKSLHVSTAHLEPAATLEAEQTPGHTSQPRQNHRRH
jgi:hypothetical protein